MTQSAKRKAEDLAIFRPFVAASHLAIGISSVEQLEPPWPDIVAIESGERCGFELTANTDSKLEKRVATGATGYSSFRLEKLSETLRKKLAKEYSPGIPVDLIIHESLAPLMPTVEDGSEIATVLKDHVGDRKFRRIWIIDVDDQKVLMRFDYVDDGYQQVRAGKKCS